MLQSDSCDGHRTGILGEGASMTRSCVAQFATATQQQCLTAEHIIHQSSHTTRGPSLYWGTTHGIPSTPHRCMYPEIHQPIKTRGDPKELSARILLGRRDRLDVGPNCAEREEFGWFSFAATTRRNAGSRELLGCAADVVCCSAKPSEKKILGQQLIIVEGPLASQRPAGT